MTLNFSKKEIDIAKFRLIGVDIKNISKKLDVNTEEIKKIMKDISDKIKTTEDSILLQEKTKLIKKEHRHRMSKQGIKIMKEELKKQKQIPLKQKSSSKINQYPQQATVLISDDGFPLPNKREIEITSEIAKEFHDVLIDRVNSDVIIIGAGPAGLTASRELSNMGFKVLVIEQNNYLGGGYWLGGYMMNSVTVREPAQKIWDELGVPYKKVAEGLYLTPGPHAVSKLIAGACDAGVKFLNLTKFDDLVIKNGRVVGIVVNWMPVSALPRNITCADPVTLEAKIIIDTSGYESITAKKLVDRGLVDWQGKHSIYITKSKEHAFNKTNEVYPGLIVTGMEVRKTQSFKRMGPTFNSMISSGKQAAKIASEKIKKLERETSEMNF